MRGLRPDDGPGADADAVLYRAPARRDDVLEGLARGRLLGGLLRGPRADPALLAVDQRGAREAALVRRPLGLEDRVRRPAGRAARAPPGARSCSRRGVVTAYSMRSANACTIGPRMRLEPVLEVERAQHRLDERREHVAVALPGGSSSGLAGARLDPLATAGFRARAAVRRRRSSLRLTTYAQAFVSRPSEKSGKRS